MDNQAIEPIDNATLFYSTDDAEPLKPTVDAVEEAPEEAEEVEQVDSEELEAEEETEEAEEEETLYLELDGEEFSLDEVKQWKAGYMMQSDYTKKTQAIADERKALEKEKEALTDLSSQLEVLVAEDSEVDWAELKEYEPEKYIELKEKADKRKAKLDEIKSSTLQASTPKLSKDELIAESNDLFESQGWKKDGKVDQAVYDADMKVLGEYMTANGYSQDEFNSLQYSRHFKTLLDAARYNLQKKKGSALVKKVKKAPTVTKPKANQTKPVKSAADTFYGS